MVAWLVCAADTVIAAGLITWLDKVGTLARVVTGVARVAFVLATLPPTPLVDTVPVTVPKVVTPSFIQGNSYVNFIT